MDVEALEQCDVTVEGAIKALFPGQRYDLPDGAVTGLLQDGKLRAVVGTVVGETVRARSRPRGK